MPQSGLTESACPEGGVHNGDKREGQPKGTQEEAFQGKVSSRDHKQVFQGLGGALGRLTPGPMKGTCWS